VVDLRGGRLQGIGSHPLTMPSSAPRRWPEDPKDERPPGIGLSVGLQINRYFLPPCVVFGGTDPFGTSLGTFNLISSLFKKFRSVAPTRLRWFEHSYPASRRCRLAPYELSVLTPPDAKRLIYDGCHTSPSVADAGYWGTTCWGQVPARENHQM
jgi:hypothetical protein